MKLDDFINLKKCIMNYKKENDEALYDRVLVSAMLQTYYLPTKDLGTKIGGTLFMDSESKTWLPVYTSLSKYGDAAEKLEVCEFNLPEIIKYVREERLDGIIINWGEEGEINIKTKDLYAVLLSYATAEEI